MPKPTTPASARPAPRFPTLPLLRAHLAAQSAGSWAADATLALSRSRRLAVVRPVGGTAWLLIAPGPGRSLYPVTLCASRRQALALCAAIEDVVELPWDDPDAEQQIIDWRGEDGANLYDTIVRLRATTTALDDRGLCAGLQAARDAVRRPFSPQEEEQCAAEPEEPPTSESDEGRVFSAAWGHFIQGPDLPVRGALPPIQEAPVDGFLNFCVSCQDYFVTGHCHSDESWWCRRCSDARRAAFDPQPGNQVRLLTRGSSRTPYLVLAREESVLHLRRLGFPDDLVLTVHLGELDPVRSGNV